MAWVNIQGPLAWVIPPHMAPLMVFPTTVLYPKASLKGMVSNLLHMANSLLLMVSSLCLFRAMTKPSNSSPLDICHLNSLPILNSQLIPSSLLILHLPTHSHPCLDSRLGLQGRAG